MLTKANRKLLEAFETWIRPRMLKISWTEKVTKKEVLICANENSSILKTFWYRKQTNRWLGQVVNHEITEVKMMARTTLDRKRPELLHDIMEGRLWTVERIT